MSRRPRRPARGRRSGGARGLPAGALALALWCLLPMARGTANATAGENQEQDRIRAAFVFNFCKFVRWPEDEPSRLVLGVMAEPDDQDSFASIAGKQVRQTSIEVRNLARGQDPADCRLLFISDEEAADLPAILAQVGDRPVLTVSEMEDFCRRGGIIQLVRSQGKFRFLINREAAERVGISLSSQLLKMAKLVEGEG